MSNLSLERLMFDPAAPADGPSIGSYLVGAGGAVVTSSGTYLDVNIAMSTGLGIYAEDSVSASGDLGQPALVLRQDVLAPGDTSADGDYAFLKSDVNGALYVKDQDVLARLVLINADSSAILVDSSAINANLASLVHLEDSGHSSGHAGVMGLAVRNDSGAVLAGSDLDYIPFSTDARGRLMVNASPSVGLSSAAVSVNDTAGGTSLGAGLAGQMQMQIQNHGDKDIWVGPSGLTKSSGLRVGKGSTHAVESGAGLAWFAIADTGNVVDVRVLRWG